jgi:hypothetical protein
LPRCFPRLPAEVEAVIAALRREFEKEAETWRRDQAEHERREDQDDPEEPTSKREREPMVEMAEQIISAGLKALAKKHHPDAGGSEAEMQRLNAAAARLREKNRESETDFLGLFRAGGAAK